MRLFLAALSVLPLAAQVTASFSPQGAASLRALTGKRIAGFQLIQVTICAQQAAVLPAGRIYQMANGAGIQTIAPKVASAIVKTTVNRDMHKIAAEMLKAGTLIGATVMGSGLVAASVAWTGGAVLAHG